MRVYDLVLVVRSGISEAERKKTLESIKNWLGEAKLETSELGKKALAYEIKKEREGIYILMNVIYSNGNVISTDIEKKILANENILRYLLVRRKARAKNGSKKS